MQKEKKVKLIAAAAILSLPVLLLQQDSVIFYEWMIYLSLIGIISIPISSTLFGKSINLQITLSKIIGILVTGFITWFICVMFNLPFRRLTCAFVIILYAACNALIWIKQQKSKKLQIVADNKPYHCFTLADSKMVFLNMLIKYEFMFFVLFLVWVYIIGFNPSAYGTEKFMDYAFLQKMLVTTKLPPDDMWYAGKAINYYYGGQYYAAFIAKSMFLKTKAEYAYNLMRAVIPATMFTGVFALVKQLLDDRAKYSLIKKENATRRNMFALLSAGLSVFGGNGHYIIYGLLQPILHVGGNDSYWFPDSTRYIGYNPVVETDQTIHEFPCYSFILGDLHAHMINIMFVVLLIGLLYSLLKTMKYAYNTPEIEKFTYPQLYFIGICLGIFNWTNYWDYIIYIVVISVTVIMANVISKKDLEHMLIDSVLQLAVIIIIAILTALPFTLNFKSVFQGVGIAENHSKLYQLFVLWGIPGTIAILFIVEFLKNQYRQYKKIKEDYIKNGSSKTKSTKKKNQLIKNAFKNIKPNEIFIFTLVCCALGLILIPELVYVRDIYESTHARANTMFKLTYQAFILFSICSGYILYIFTDSRKAWLKLIARILLALQILTLGYAFNAKAAWFGNTYPWTDRKGIYALDYLDEDDFKNEKSALLWLKDKAESGDTTGIIAEAPGSSYTANERVSVITGLSTPAGWLVHEWLWRDSYDGIKDRSDDIDIIYEGAKTEAQQILKKYNIQYIFFGQREQEKYGENAKDRIKKYGNVTYQDSSTMIVQIF